MGELKSPLFAKPPKDWEGYVRLPQGMNIREEDNGIKYRWDKQKIAIYILSLVLLLVCWG